MGCGNQPVGTAMEEGKDEFDITNKPIGADGGGWNPGAYSFVDDIMSLPFVSLGYEQFPGRDIREDEMLPPDLSMRGHGADCLMSPTVTSMDYGKSEIPMNFTPLRGETGTGYPIKTHGADAQHNRISRFQMSGLFPPSKCSTSLLPLVDNFGATGNTNDINIVPLSSNSPHKVDRNFLTLGIGGGIEVRPNSNFNTREISNKLDEVSSQCNDPIAGHCPKNPSNLTQLVGGDARFQSNAGGLSRPDSNFHYRKLSNNSSIGHWPENPMSLTQLSGGNARTQPNAGGLSISNSDFDAQATASRLEGVSFQCNTSTVGHYPKNPSNLTQLAGGSAMIQTNAGGLSRPASNLASGMPTCVEGGPIGDAGFRLNSTLFPGLQKLQANIPSYTPNCTSISLSTTLSLPSGSTLFSQPKCSPQPEIASTYFATQPISWQQDYSRKSSMKLSSESSSTHLSHRHKQSSIGHAQPGDFSSAAEGTRTEVAKIGSFPSSVQPVGQFDAFHNVSPIEASGNYISPERIGVQFSKSITYQSAAAAGYYPKRLGLQPNDFATARSARGPAPVHLAAYHNQFRPVVPTGQPQHGMPAQSSAGFPRVDHSNGQVTPVAILDDRPQVAPIISRPPLKRKAFENPSALSGQQRKTFLRPVGNDSTPQQRQRIPSIPAAVHIPPAPPLHVKWKGCDEPLGPTGQRCLLCKRDLSFTAEGLVYQPAAPPPVAVLPCGHTFHDHCLQIITPEDQLKNPPCIPCAVGET